jgi:glyoxylase I family protein
VEIHHVALRTRDVARLEAFYAGILGLNALRRDGDRSVWLAAGRAIVMIEAREPSEPEPPRGSMEMVAFAIAPAERKACARRIEAAGFPIEAETRFTIYTRDPDGRRVGLSHYPEVG